MKKIWLFSALMSPPYSEKLGNSYFHKFREKKMFEENFLEAAPVNSKVVFMNTFHRALLGCYLNSTVKLLAECKNILSEF